MKLDKKSLLLYAVTDRSWLGEETLYSQVERALKGGATMIQLREKEMTEEAFIAEAQSIKELCGRYGVPFIINDSTAVAAAVDADGVHVARVTWKQVMSAGGLEKTRLSACLRRRWSRRFWRKSREPTIWE